MRSITRAFCLVSLVGLNACMFEPLLPDAGGDAAIMADATPASDTTPATDSASDAAVITDTAADSTPATDGNPPADTGVVPVDNGPPRECSPGAVLSVAPCLGVPNTWTVCGPDGRLLMPDGHPWCMFRPGCDLSGCGSTDAGVPADMGMPTDSSTPADAGNPLPPHVTTDEACDGRRLTGLPMNCQGARASSVCYHVCEITPVFEQTSNHPNSELRPVYLRFIQTEDSTATATAPDHVTIATINAPPVPTTGPLTGVQTWEAGAYVAIRSAATGGYPFFNVENHYERAVTGPFPYLFAVGLAFRGMGLTQHGNLRIYRVNADLTQSLVAWEMVANEPALLGGIENYGNGGNAHVLTTGCPAYLTVRTSGLHRCTP